MFKSTILYILLLNTITIFSMNNNNNITVIGSYDSYACTLTFQDKTYECSLGRNGITNNKMEGDGKTPIGSYPIRRALYREDKVSKDMINPLLINKDLNIIPLLPCYGWCDDSNDVMYNMFLDRLPYPASHEDLWLNGTSYDIMAVIGYNDSPVVPDKGSAIFFHVTESYGSTSGCVALHIDDLITVLSNIKEDTYMNILPY